MNRGNVLQKRISTLLLVLLVFGTMLFAEKEIPAATILQGYSSPLPCPDFSLEDLAGNKINIRDFRGKAVLINFWTTW